MDVVMVIEELSWTKLLVLLKFWPDDGVRELGILDGEVCSFSFVTCSPVVDA